MKSVAVNIESIVSELMDHYGIDAPPVPIEAILQNPARGMWQEVAFSALPPEYVSLKEPFALRLALARLLVDMLLGCPWGEERGLAGLSRQEKTVPAMTRALLMPRSLLMGLPATALNPPMVRLMFEVPLEEARRRLIEVDVLIP